MLIEYDDLYLKNHFAEEAKIEEEEYQVCRRTGSLITCAYTQAMSAGVLHSLPRREKIVNRQENNGF